MLGIAGLLPHGALHAQSTRPLKFVVPQPAGNPTDGIARKLQPLFQSLLGQPVLVENLPGAGGSIGIQRVLSSNEPQLLITSQTEPILTPLAMAGARYKPEELRCIALAGRTTYVLAGRPNLPASNLAELTALARGSSGSPLSYGHIGQGSMIHLIGEHWSRKAGGTLTHVPYKGVPPIVQDLMGSQIDLTFLPMGGSTPTLIDTGKVKAYGITWADPLASQPKLLPLGRQDKALAGFDYGTWAAVLVPRSTPENTVQQLHQALSKALENTELQQYTSAGGVVSAGPMSLAELDRFYQQETRLYQTLAREIGVTPQ